MTLRAAAAVHRLLPLAATLLLAPAALAAHEIPARVAVHAFVKPEQDRLRVLVRVPLESLRDLDLRLTPEGYLTSEALAGELTKAAEIWVAGYLTIYENGRALADPRVAGVRVALPADRAFESYSTASAAFAAPLLSDTQLHWQHALVDVALEYRITSAASDFAIRPALAHLGIQTVTTLRFLAHSGAERAYQYKGDPGLVRLDPRWYHAALSFVQLGFGHILHGIDHLLFLLCLVIPFRRIYPLIGVVTAFTLAHSITLVATALGFAPTALWFPPFIETLIALSIVLMALENIIGARLERRWIVAFAFGLVHGFGFAFGLRESLQFAGSHLLTSLLAFNIGVELGQIAVLVVIVPALALLLRDRTRERAAVIVLSALVAHSAWHWTADRFAALREYRVTWPAFDAAFVVALLRGTLVATVAAAALWLSWQVVSWLTALPQRERADT